MKKENQDPFNAFGWDEETAEIDFFGEVEKNVNAPLEEEKTEEESEESETEKEKQEKIEQEKDEVFKDLETFEEEDEEDSDEIDVAPSKTPTTNIKDSVKHLIEEGILDLDEDEELPEDVDSNYLYSKIEKSIEKKFEDSVAGLPDDVKNLIKFVHNGGSMKDFVSSISDSFELSEDIDLDDEDNQEKVMRHLLKEDGEDNELIEAQIEFLKDSGKLSSITQRKFNRWKAEKKEETDNLLAQQRQQKTLARENQIKFKKDIGDLLSESQEIKGLSVSQKEIQELPSYISDTSVKLQDGRQITPFYRDLFESLKEPEKLIALAKLVKSDFDFSDIKKGIVTKQTRKLKEDLQRQNKSPEKRSSQKTRLIDLI